MKKTNQFDDIKAGELIRFLKNPMRGNSPRNNWSFGIVAYRLKTTFAFTLSEDPHIQKASLSGTTE